MFHEITLVIIGVVATIVGTIYAIKAYNRSKEVQYGHEQQKSDIVKEIMNTKQDILFKFEGKGELTKLDMTILRSEQMSGQLSKIFLRFILDDNNPLTKNIEELIQQGHAHERLIHMHGDRNITVNYNLNYTFSKGAKVIFENQANQGFRYNSSVEAKYVKK